MFHELNPIGTVLGYDDAGRDKGNADKAAEDVQGYDTDNRAMIDFLNKQARYDGNLGAAGFCIGGHLAFRAALQPEVKATGLFLLPQIYIPQSSQTNPVSTAWNALTRLRSELLMIWGKQDPHVPADKRAEAL